MIGCFSLSVNLLTKKFLQPNTYTGTANILNTSHLFIHLRQLSFSTDHYQKNNPHSPDIENQNPGNAGSGHRPASGASWVRPVLI